MSFQLRTLGTANLLAEHDGESRPLAVPPKSLAVLVYLVLGGTSLPQRRDMVIALFWPDRPQRRARNTLSQVLFGLRRTLGEGVLIGHGHEEIEVATDRLLCDAAAFDARYRAGELVEALQLYRGHFLEGFHLSNCVGFERWQELERARLKRQALDAATRLANVEEERENLLGVSHWLRRALDISPTDQRSIRRLVGVLGRAGEPIAALEAYEQFKDRLLRDLDLEPDEETEALVEALELKRRRVAAREEIDNRVAQLQVELERGRGPVVESIAVLPLRDLSAQSGEDYFVDGLTEALILELSKIEALRVISRQSVMQYRGSDKPLSAIGRELGVQGVVEGSVLRAGDRVRVTVQLLQIEPERHLWADSFDRGLQDVLALHRDVARAVAREVRIALSPADRKRLAGPAKVNPSAYDAYLRGRYLLLGVDVMQAAAYFRVAMEIDPAYAPAYAGLALTQWTLAIFAYASSEATRPIAEAAAARAREIDPDLAEAHTAFGCCRSLFTWDWAAADAAFRRGIELNPGSSEAHGYYGVYLTLMGRSEEGIAELRRMVEYDPIAPTAALGLGWALHKARRHEDAISQLTGLLDTHPRVVEARPFLAASYVIVGRPSDAIDIVEGTLALVPEDQLTLGYGAWTMARAGRREAAAAMLSRLEGLAESRHLEPYYPAVANVGLDEVSSALRWLERTYAERSPSAIHLRSDPLLDPLREEPRFREILASMHFPNSS